MHRFIIAAKRQIFNFRTSRIRQAHNTRNLVEGFACCIVARLAQHLKGVVAGDLQKCRMTAADHKRHERRLQLAVRQKVGKDMAFKMVDAD